MRVDRILPKNPFAIINRTRVESTLHSVDELKTLLNCNGSDESDSRIRASGLEI